MKKDFSPIRGTRDFLPADMLCREAVRQKILAAYKKNGFMHIETPILENLEFLLGSDGGDNLKLIFKTLKRKDKLDLTIPNLTENDIAAEGLRYDLTVPLARFFCDNKEELPVPFRAIQTGYVFRAERPQKGRMRQFVQCDVDIIGDNSNTAEIEVLTTVLEALADIGFKNLVVKINDRRMLNSVIAFCGFAASDAPSVCISLDKIDKIEASGVEKELVEKNFDKKAIKKLLEAIETIRQKGIDACTNYGVDKSIVEELKQTISIAQANAKNAKFDFDLKLVRGQGYYTGTVFEIYCDAFRGAISGGGRYDNMIKDLTGQQLSAVGLSIGFEVICMLIKELAMDVGIQKSIAILYDKIEDYGKAVIQKKELVNNGYTVAIYKTPKNTKELLLRLKNCGVGEYKFIDKPVSRIGN